MPRQVSARGSTASPEGLAAQSEKTRAGLVETALELFGSHGFDATSTREIASSAKANIASIGYHFGGKEGLRRACAEYVVKFISSVAASGFAVSGLKDISSLTPEEARTKLKDFIRQAVYEMLTRPSAERIVRFVVREVTNPSTAISIIYAGVIEPTHRRLCRLWARATGEEAESEAVRLAVFAIMGQAIYFRLGQEIVNRRMGWEHYGDEEAHQILDEITANLMSALDRHSMNGQGK